MFLMFLKSLFEYYIGKDRNKMQMAMVPILIFCNKYNFFHVY